MEQLNPTARRDAYGTKINRDHSPVLLYATPWLSILLASLSPMLPIIASAPVLPPLGFMTLVAWRLLRPGVVPLWAGFPLGLFDDLFSGQPLGSGILLFSITIIVIDLLELRFPWRGFWQDWLTASVLIAAFLAIAAMVSGSHLTIVHMGVILPQIILSIVLFPVIARLVSLLDRLRLLRIRKLS